MLLQLPADLNELSQLLLNIILLEYQLLTFFETEHWTVTHLLRNWEIIILKGVRAFYSPSVLYWKWSASEGWRVRAMRFISLEGSDPYLSNWIIDLSDFHEVCKTFDRLIQPFVKSSQFHRFLLKWKLSMSESSSESERPISQRSLITSLMSEWQLLQSNSEIFRMSESDFSASVPSALRWSEQQKAELQSMFQAEVQRKLMSWQQNEMLSHESAGLMRPSGLKDSVSNVTGGQFWAQDLRYFHPDLKELYELSDIMYVNRDTLYQKVYTFIKWAADFIMIKGTDTVQWNISTCLRGAALQWWLLTLSEDERNMYMTSPDDLTWFNWKISQWFKMLMSSALKKLNNETYSLTDAKNWWEPYAYVQWVVQYVTAADIIEEYVQASWAWNHLNVKLQLSVLLSTMITFIVTFTEHLNDQKEVWFQLQKWCQSEKKKKEQNKDKKKNKERDKKDRFVRDDTSSRYNQNSEYNSHQVNAEQQNFPLQNHLYEQNCPFQLNNFMNYSQGAFSNYQSFSPYPSALTSFSSFSSFSQYDQIQSGSYLNAISALNFSVQNAYQSLQSTQSSKLNCLSNANMRLTDQKLITAATADTQSQPWYASNNLYANWGVMNNNWNGRNGLTNAWNSEYYQASVQQTYQAGLKQEAYHTNSDFQLKAYFTEGPSPDNSEDFQSLKAYYRLNEYAGNEQKQGEESEVSAGFMNVHHVNEKLKGSPFSCHHCSQEFESNNLLHKHLTGCKVKKGQNRRSLMKSESAKTDQTSVFDTVIITLTSKEGKNDELSFRSWHYCTVNISFTVLRIVTSVCIDTDCTMTLINRSFIWEHLPWVQFKKLMYVILIYRIRSSCYFCSEWVKVNFFLTEEMTSEPVTVKFSHEVHIVENLKVKLLISMNILATEEVIINL